MFGYPKWKLDVLERRIGDFENSMRGWWEKQEELRKKVNGLYGHDTHDTERPKVDMLSDYIDNEILYEQIELRNRIDDLEKKK